jgi:type III restriction enzyme
MFEEEYRRAAHKQEYAELFESADLKSEAEAVHDGYFSIDKKNGRLLDTAENNETGRENAERAYNLIMRDKKKLLSFESKLKFIFSHSALKEGWDNPNVFQICNFSSQDTERWRRQTIGRGLRIAVNQDGNRVYGFDVNTLTVIANESYESFAENLQKDIESETKIKFGVVTAAHLAAVIVRASDGSESRLGIDNATNLIAYLKDAQLLDAEGMVSDTLSGVLRNNGFSLPAPFTAYIDDIRAAIIRTLRRVEIKNSSDSQIVKPRRAVLDSHEFRELWDRIKFKTQYRVHFDNKALIQECAFSIKNLASAIGKPKIIIRKAALSIDRAGVEATESSNMLTVVTECPLDLPDILTELEQNTQLTRKSIAEILIKSASLEHFKRNPQGYIAMAVGQINETKKRLIVDGIKYQKLGSDHFYSQELFLNEELKGYIGSILKDAKRSAFEHVVYQSDIEKRFAEELERNEAVKVYAKLPSWFKIKTPLGDYTPDWAVLIEEDEAERLYFVVETKGSTSEEDLRGNEISKINCGKAHFNAIAEGNDRIRFQLAKEFSYLLT